MRIFVIGDSHSVLLGPAIIYATRDLGWSLVGQVSK